MRLVLILIILSCTTLLNYASAVDVDRNVDDGSKIIAAAKAANLHYQHQRSDLINQLKSEDMKIRVEAIDLLGRLQEQSLIPVLSPYLDFNLHQEAEVMAACRSLARLGAQNVLKELTAITTDTTTTTKSMRVSAWNALGQLKQMSSIHFTDQSGNLDDAIRASGITNLGTFKDQDAGKILANALTNDRRRHIRRMAAIGLGKLGDDSYAKELINALSDGDVMVRRYAASSLVKLDHKAAIPYLLIHLEANVGGKYLNEALVKLSGQDFGYSHNATLSTRRDAIRRGFEWYSENF